MKFKTEVICCQAEEAEEEDTDPGDTNQEDTTAVHGLQKEKRFAGSGCLVRVRFWALCSGSWAGRA